jgi:hypothetical protein
MRVQALKRQVKGQGYEVDASAVAAAILRRPSARRLILNGAARPSRADAQSRPPSARRDDR